MMIGFAGLHVSHQDKRSTLTWRWVELGARTLHVDIDTVTLELPAAWRGQAMSPHMKYVCSSRSPTKVRDE